MLGDTQKKGWPEPLEMPRFSPSRPGGPPTVQGRLSGPLDDLPNQKSSPSIPLTFFLYSISVALISA